MDDEIRLIRTEFAKQLFVFNARDIPLALPKKLALEYIIQSPSNAGLFLYPFNSSLVPSTYKFTGRLLMR